jgi:Fe2+ transport system protein FeoA
MNDLSHLRLSDLGVGATAVISKITLPEEDCRRMNVLGFAVGSEVFVSRTVPGGNPTVYEVDGNHVALRREAAMHVLVSGASAWNRSAQ